MSSIQVEFVVECAISLELFLCALVTSMTKLYTFSWVFEVLPLEDLLLAIAITIISVISDAAKMVMVTVAPMTAGRTEPFPSFLSPTSILVTRKICVVADGCMVVSPSSFVGGSVVAGGPAVDGG